MMMMLSVLSYVVNAAREARVSGMKQRLVYLSVRFLPSFFSKRWKHALIMLSYAYERVFQPTPGLPSSTAGKVHGTGRVSSVKLQINLILAMTIRSKGQTEAELAAIGYDDFIVLRPGMFDNPDRTGTSREGESLP